jgi:hypothetical protein
MNGAAKKSLSSDSLHSGERRGQRRETKDRERKRNQDKQGRESLLMAGKERMDSGCVDIYIYMIDVSHLFLSP